MHRRRAAPRPPRRGAGRPRDGRRCAAARSIPPSRASGRDGPRGRPDRRIRRRPRALRAPATAREPSPARWARPGTDRRTPSSASLKIYAPRTRWLGEARLSTFRRTMDTDRLLRELTEFLRIPSVSTLPAHNSDCRRAAEWVAVALRRLGCRDVQFLGSDSHPVVWGVGPAVPGAPTLLLYGHYDVQPPDPLDEWTAPPFEPTVRDAKLFARGAADDKGQVFCLLKAIEATGRPPVNFRFLIEGEEEYGSRVLFELLRREPGRTKADAVLVADMAYVAPGWPAVYTT